MEDFKAEILALLKYLNETRNLQVQDAVAVMGETIAVLMRNDDNKRNFLKVLEKRMFRQLDS